MYLWCQMGESSTLADYLEHERKLLALTPDDDLLMAFLEIGNQLEGAAESLLYHAVLAYLHGEPQDCLDSLASVQRSQASIPSWMVMFWQVMAYTALEMDSEAQAALGAALAEGVPPILLLPLRWFKQTRPDFFDVAFRPSFLVHHLPYRESWGYKERKKVSKSRVTQGGQ